MRAAGLDFESAGPLAFGYCFFHQPTELQAELHRHNRWHTGHGAMGDTHPGLPAWSPGSGSRSLEPRRPIRSSPAWAMPRPGPVMRSRQVAFRTTSVVCDGGQAPSAIWFPDPGPRGRGAGTERYPCVPGNQGSSQSHRPIRTWEPSAQGSNWLDDDTVRNVRSQLVAGVSPITRCRRQRKAVVGPMARHALHPLTAQRP